MDVGAKLIALRDASHGSDHPIPHDQRTDISASGLGDELLDQHVLSCRLQCLDDCLGHLVVRGQDHSDPLGPLQEFDDHRGAADPSYRSRYVLAVTDKGRARDPDVVAGQDLH